MKKVVVLASGGADSSTLLYYYAVRFGRENVTALSISYGQRHKRELACADAVCGRLGCNYIQLDLENVFAGSRSTLVRTDTTIAAGNYADQKKESESGVIPTNVELRNLVFSSISASIAMQTGAQVLAIGVHASDIAYPDCSPEFIETLSKAVHTGSAGLVNLEAPFLHFTKGEIIRLGMTLGVPYEVTWSCYRGGENPCGECATCRDRATAFAEAGYDDPAFSRTMAAL